MGYQFDAECRRRPRRELASLPRWEKPKATWAGHFPRALKIVLDLSRVWTILVRKKLGRFFKLASPPRKEPVFFCFCWETKITSTHPGNEFQGFRPAEKRAQKDRGRDLRPRGPKAIRIPNSVPSVCRFIFLVPPG